MNYRLIFKEKVHSLASLALSVIVIIFILLSHSVIGQLSLWILILSYFLYCGANLRHLIKTIGFTFSFALIYMIMPLVFPGPESSLFGKNLHEMMNFDLIRNSKEFFVFCRLFFVSSISVISLFVIQIEVVFLYLAQKTKAPLMLIYPLLFAVNSVQLFKKKFDLFRFNNRLRRVKGLVLPRLLFQFLVYILRFSEAGSLSLISRGISRDKVYYYDFSFSKRDRLVFIITLFLTTVLQLLLVKGLA